MPAADVEEALQREGVPAEEAQEATRQLLDARAAQATQQGLVPTSPPLATRAPPEAALYSRIHR